MKIQRLKIKPIFVTCLGALLCLTSVEADAMSPLPLVDTAPSPDVTLVVGGCGVGFHRGPAGACRANGVAMVGGPVVAGARVGVVGARVGVAGVTRAGVGRRVSRRTARRTSRRVARRHFR